MSLDDRGACVVHNLQLALLDLTKELLCVSQVEETVKAIFKWYYYSPKQRREVNKIAEILDESHVYFNGVHQVRWLTSRSRAFAVLQKHLDTAVPRSRDLTQPRQMASSNS